MKGFSKTVLFLGMAALFGVFVVPKLPQLMMAAGITGQATGGAVEPLQVGSPNFDDLDWNDGLVIEWSIPVENPNPFPATVDKITYSVYVDDEEVSEGTISKGETIPANGESDLTDRVRPDISESLSAGAGTMWNELTGETTYVKVKGDIHVSAGPTTFKVPFENREPL